LSAPAAKVRRILLVDDHAAVRRGFALLIERESDLKVCGEASGPADGLREIRRLKPDLVLADLSLGEGSGLDFIQAVRRRFPKLPVLVVSMHEESLFAERALRAGANGYIMKEATPEGLLSAVRRVLDGRLYLSDATSESLLETLLGKSAPREDPFQKMSDRELQIFQSIGEGLSTTEIAENMHISAKTVDTYRARLKARLGLETSAELLRHAIRWNRERRAR
jgi:DNA-binding NarL/FixJ family response regulator